MITWLCKCCDLGRTEFTHCDTGYWTKCRKQEALRDHRPPPTPTRLVFPLPKNVATCERLHRHANTMVRIVSSPNCLLSWESWCEIIISWCSEWFLWHIKLLHSFVNLHTTMWLGCFPSFDRFIPVATESSLLRFLLLEPYPDKHNLTMKYSFVPEISISLFQKYYISVPRIYSFLKRHQSKVCPGSYFKVKDCRMLSTCCYKWHAGKS